MARWSTASVMASVSRPVVPLRASTTALCEMASTFMVLPRSRPRLTRSQPKRIAISVTTRWAAARKLVSSTMAASNSRVWCGSGICR